MLEWVWEQVATNQFAAGGLFLGAVGGAVAWARNIPGSLARRLANQVIVTIDVTSDDPVFDWLQVWLAEHPYSRRARHLDVVSRLSGLRRGGYDPDEDEGAAPEAVPVYFTPAPNTEHLFWHRGRLVWLSRQREKSTSSSIRGAWTERLRLRLLGRSTAAVRDLIAEAQALAATTGEPRIPVSVPSGGNYWRRVSEQVVRPLTSVILPAGVVEAAVADVQSFLDSRAWYLEQGIPYRRGYLFHGAPGAGKSSLIQALAGHFRLPLYILSLNGKGISDAGLLALMTDLPARAAVVLEDVDADHRGRPTNGDDDDERVTFSGLLNALDGVAGSDGRLLFMTTNHLERLDGALIRPGRADYRVAFGPVTPEQAARGFTRFFGTEQGAALFGSAVARQGWTMAKVQEFLLTRRGDPTQALVDCGAL